MGRCGMSGAQPPHARRRALHPCPLCGHEHHCATDLCATCRDSTDLTYRGGWYVKGGVWHPAFPERKRA